MRRRDLLLATSGVGAALIAERASGRPRPSRAAPAQRGIYVSQTTLYDREKLEGLLRLCSSFGVQTMVVDLWSSSQPYSAAVRTILGAGIAYVPRVLVFPEGGTAGTVLRRDYWEKRMRSVEAGLELGAQRIQLDYIRYNTAREPRRQHAFDILAVLQFFSQAIRASGARVEIDVFGDAAGGPSDRIGQDLRLFGPHVDTVCPMAYPSHYRPYESSWQKPFQVVRSSVKSAQNQLPAQCEVKAYVEMFNLRTNMSDAMRSRYIRRQIQGAISAGAAGWYAWSSTNSYGLLFDALAAYGERFEHLDS